LENVDNFDGHLEYFTVIWDILGPFGTFFRFWYNVARKIWQTWAKASCLFHSFPSERLTKTRSKTG
jgi:hypothetical protein